MADIRPFRALRPAPLFAAQVHAPPYDVVEVEEARAEGRRSDLSFLHVTRAEIDLPQGSDPYSREVYLKGRENLRRMIEQGVLCLDEEPSFYVYRQDAPGHSQTGIVGAASVEEYTLGVIRKHEQTRPEKVEDRLKHMKAVEANSEAVFLMYRSVGEIEEVVQAVCERAEADTDVQDTAGVRHRVWKCRSDVVGKIAGFFSRQERLYIADGHHRTEAAVMLRGLHGRRSAGATGAGEAPKEGNTPGESAPRPEDYFMVVIYPHSSVRVLAYNRIVKPGIKLDIAGFKRAVADNFDVSEVSEGAPTRRGEIRLFAEGRWFSLRYKGPQEPEEGPSPERSLDVSLLQDKILAPCFSITDPRNDRRIEFVGGVGPDELARRAASEGALAFSLFPVSPLDIMRVADAGELMPPKSTWFDPKIRSGLFVRPLWVF